MRTLSVILALLFAAAAWAQDKKNSADVKRGRYLVTIGGCNDCHTPGYPISGGKVDEKLWLTGEKVGWRGPWGTTYAPNLRLAAANMTEQQWMTGVRREMRPPMPWFNLRDMADKD